jgi:ribosomal protein L40E
LLKFKARAARLLASTIVYDDLEQRLNSMIVCPNCNHPNPDGAVQCEACYTPLPSTSNCPSCGATVQADAAFCGQCGFNLRVSNQNVAATVAPDIPMEVSPLTTPDPLVQAQPLVVTAPANPSFAEAPPAPPTVVAVNNEEIPTESSPPVSAPEPEPEPEPEPVVIAAAPEPEPEPEPEPLLEESPPEIEPLLEVSPPVMEAATELPEPVVAAPVTLAKTQLQQLTAQLVHLQSDQQIELPQNLSVIHIGKPNDRIPPDIDVSGFPSSEIVSRIHADIRVEGDSHYIEDVGSSNGTYINNLPLLPGNRHKLRTGDRISLGKGDMVTFLFQLS